MEFDRPAPVEESKKAEPLQPLKVIEILSEELGVDMQNEGELMSFLEAYKFKQDLIATIDATF